MCDIYLEPSSYQSWPLSVTVTLNQAGCTMDSVYCVDLYNKLFKISKSGPIYVSRPDWRGMDGRMDMKKM